MIKAANSQLFMNPTLLEVGLIQIVKHTLLHVIQMIRQLYTVQFERP